MELVSDPRDGRATRIAATARLSEFDEPSTVAVQEAFLDQTFAPVTWEPVDEHRVLGSYTHGSHLVRAELVFDDDGDLVDFISDDRLRAARGNSYVGQRWSTPLTGYRVLRGRRVATLGSARWHAPEPEGVFANVEMAVDDLETGSHPVPARPPDAIGSTQAGAGTSTPAPCPVAVP